MLSRAFNRTQAKSLLNTLQRGVYTKETQPHVFINEHTKVLVQGMTGKHVSCDLKLNLIVLILIGNLPYQIIH